jgi:hypothetical protein
MKWVKAYYNANKITLPTAFNEIPFFGLLAISTICVFLYNSNYQHIAYTDFLVTTLICALVVGVIIFIAYLIFRSWVIASLSMGFVTIGVFAYDTIVTHIFIHLPNLYSPRYFILANGLLIVLLFAIAFFIATRKFARNAHQFLSITLCLVFVFNLVVAVRNNKHWMEVLSRENLHLELADPYAYAHINMVSEVERDDVNIYFFIFDTMMSVRAVKEYFGAEIDDELELLREMGFHIIESGSFININTTRFSFASLLSPRFFDEYLKKEFELVRHTLRYNYPEFEDINAQTKNKWVQSIHFTPIHSELFAAFRKKNYTVQYTYVPDVVSMGKFISKVTCYHTVYSFIHRRYFRQSRVPSFSSPMWHNRREKIEHEIHRINELNSEKKQLFFSHFFIPHCPYIYFMDGTERTESEMLSLNVDFEAHMRAFMEQWVFSLRLMISSMESILHNDPKAVIVIIGDHGIGGDGEGAHSLLKHFIDDPQYTPADLDILRNEIFVALRLEDCADAVNNPIFRDPHNIVRYLVNTYVGENYEYLSYP